MKLEMLRCPNCHAPVEGLRGTQAVCRYCGATIAAGQPPAPKTETRFSLALRVGPSNLDRIAALLCQRLGSEPAETRSRLASVPYQIEFGTDESGARALASQLVHAGAQVDVVERTVEIPLVSVLLEEVGTNKLAPIVAIRQFVDLGREEARQLVARAPVVVVDAMLEPRALELVTALRKAGARARLGDQVGASSPRATSRRP